MDNTLTGAPLTADWGPCAYYANLGELDRADPQNPGGGYWAEFSCNYSLGERLFLDLYRTLGRDQFQQGFRNLYRATKGRSVHGGIDAVDDAFKKGAGPDVIAAVDTVINRWYYGTEPYDLSYLDDRPADPSLPSINGRIADAFISLDQEWPADADTRTSQVSISELKEIEGRVYLYRRFEFSQSTELISVPLETVEYYMDGFAFDREIFDFYFQPGRTSGWWRTPLGPSDPDRWVTGRYWVMMYDGERKVAQVEYEVTP